MSHELRTPLNAIIGFSEIMALEAFGPLGEARYLSYARDVVGAGRHLLGLIDGVLDRGLTLARAKEMLEEAGAAAILSAVAVVKSHPQPLFKADHAMFSAGEEFLFGYGMDRAGLGRGMPDIRVKRG